MSNSLREQHELSKEELELEEVIKEVLTKSSIEGKLISCAKGRWITEHFVAALVDDPNSTLNPCYLIDLRTLKVLGNTYVYKYVGLILFETVGQIAFYGRYTYPETGRHESIHNTRYISQLIDNKDAKTEEDKELHNYINLCALFSMSMWLDITLESFNGCSNYFEDYLVKGNDLLSSVKKDPLLSSYDWSSY